MQVIQSVLRQQTELAAALTSWRDFAPDLLLAFGPVDALRSLNAAWAAELPATARLGCTTAGEISGQGVSDGACVVTAVRFDAASVQVVSTPLAAMADSFSAGQALARQLPAPELRGVWVMAQGVNINGSAMIAGLSAVLGPDVLVTGGLAGDAGAFKETFVLDTSGVHANRLVCAGFYGDSLQISHGSAGGWEPFGPARKVTRCADNVLYEMDGEPALAIYKRYLGEHAKDLPASGLLFPLARLGRDHADIGLIRTILAVDEAQGSLTLAGDVEPDGYLRLMHASTDGLVNGAEAAAQAAHRSQRPHQPGLALLVSCVGRKLVMGGRVEEEIEAVAEVLGPDTVLTGFYSYGEICPVTGELVCKLHNQTMTITYLTEAGPALAA